MHIVAKSAYNGKLYDFTLLRRFSHSDQGRNPKKILAAFPGRHPAISMSRAVSKCCVRKQQCR